MKKNNEKKQIAWLNGAKLIAILGVMIDHTNGMLYTKPDIAYACFFVCNIIGHDFIPFKFAAGGSIQHCRISKK